MNTRLTRPGRRAAALALMGAGLAMASVALAADLIGAGGQRGLGAKQLVLLAVGGIIFLVGIATALPATWQRVERLRERARRGVPPPTIAMLALWFGLVSGLTEALYQLARFHFVGTRIFSGADLIWMAPVADMLFMSLIALLLAPLGRLVPRLRGLDTRATIFGAAAALAVLVNVVQLQDWAQWVLAAGIGAQVGRLVGRFPAHFSLLVRFTVGWIALPRILGIGRGDPGPAPASPSRREFIASTGVAVAATAVALGGAPMLRGRAAIERRRSAAPPNVLLVVLDTVRAASLSLHGYARRTSPLLERVSADAIRFDHAIATAPWTLPSHASMFTGRFPNELTTSWRTPLSDRYPTLAEILGARGYRTGGITANVWYTSREFGLARGFDHYEDYPRNVGQILRSSAIAREVSEHPRVRSLLGRHDDLNRKRADRVVDRLLAWIGDGRGQPFFAFANLYDAHQPYLPPEPFASRFHPDRPRGHMTIGEPLDEALVSELQAAYDGAIAYVDHELARLFEALETRGLLDSTVVIVTSDHGEEFMEHGVMGHTNSLYLPALHVPLLIRLPDGHGGGQRIATPVSLRDLPVTILELVGARATEHPFPGSSLLALAQGQGTYEGTLLSEVDRTERLPEHYPTMQGDMKSLVSEGYHYIRNFGSGREELYDLALDPWETSDLSTTGEGAELVARFRERMDRVVGL